MTVTLTPSCPAYVVPGGGGEGTVVGPEVSVDHALTTWAGVDGTELASDPYALYIPGSWSAHRFFGDGSPEGGGVFIGTDSADNGLVLFNCRYGSGQIQLNEAEPGWVGGYNFSAGGFYFFAFNATGLAQDDIISLPVTGAITNQGTLSFQGGIDLRTQGVTISGDIDSDGFLIVIDCAAGNVSMPLPASPRQGMVLIIKRLDSGVNINTCTIGRNGMTIDLAASDITLANLAAVRLVYFPGDTDSGGSLAATWVKA